MHAYRDRSHSVYAQHSHLALIKIHSATTLDLGVSAIGVEREWQGENTLIETFNT